MTRRRLDLVLADFSSELEDARELVLIAAQLPMARQQTTPSFRVKHFEKITELAFISSFLAWERLIEGAFILYTLGKSAPNGFKPRLFISPTSKSHAIKFAKGDKRFPLWDDYHFVIERSSHFFESGRPFTTTLRLIKNQLENMKTLRNSIAHSSASSQEKFKTLVRTELTHVTPQLTPGGFLLTLVPHQNPQMTFFDLYLENLSWAADKIIPT